ncbi:serine arginine repetitive matrix protein 2 [Moesziomyces antarcticus]|uniref:Serine arginine repetitive matrix protein 2 n=2 Tax=Pseudozyma antarctica TaxID=84753 RepID=A0A081CDR4_PSEA2|nr:serine arginine repetitive matrix protein 2 [Moesziomyces antarcticus]GAK64810.1 serine arginine repetitive matrix protein 2 [Moesziomyces antarcticus]SPO45802.1 uncharacterized protein PSANT_03488 [Moesziomyces antarcticus]
MKPVLARVAAVSRASRVSRASTSAAPHAVHTSVLARTAHLTPFAKTRSTGSSFARGYSTAPNQQQVLQSFGTPFAHFVYTLSRIARIITFSAVGVATIGLVSFEAAHQYVEHIAMPAEAASASSSDEYGWNELALEESWSGSPAHRGTDPTLGIKGRHAVRSAWMCVNWGGGIAPGVLFGGGAAGNAGLGRTAITSMASAKQLRVDDGMLLAMQYLNVAVKVAASKGIELPDTDAIRAGLAQPGQTLGDVDPLALALEAKLAAVKERQGSKGAMESAIGNYEKLYDIASLADRGDRSSRLVRLATKLGDLHSALGRNDDAQQWLQRGIAIAAAAGAHTPHSPTTAAPEAKDKPSGGLRGWFGSAPTPDPSTEAQPEPAPAAAAGVVATPALTRSLITALVASSAHYARSASGASLQNALQTQMSALQLSTAELERLASAPVTRDAELHALWITHHQSILELHVAETMYAISKSGSLPRSLLFGKKDAKRQPIQWLAQADERASGVVAALSQEGELASRWKGERQVEAAAARVLRDAKRVRETANRSRTTLEAK